MSDIESALARTAASTKFGLLTRKQLLEAGLSLSQIRTRIETGDIHHVAHGVYSRHRPGWLDMLRAVVHVRLGGAAVVSHRSAARLHGLWPGDEVDITVRYPARAAAEGVSVHRSRDLVGRVVVGIDGLPATSVARTLCDLGLVLPDWDVRRLIEHSIARGLVTVEQLESVRWGVSEHGRNGVAAVDAAIAALPGAAASAESGPEVRLMSLLQDAVDPAPTPQYPVRIAGRRYRLDFAYPAHKVAIEYDGEEFHSTDAQRRGDAQRQAALESAGWTVLRFTRHDLYSPTDGAIVAAVKRSLRGRGKQDL